MFRVIIMWDYSNNVVRMGSYRRINVNDILIFVLNSYIFIVKII